MTDNSLIGKHVHRKTKPKPLNGIVDVMPLRHTALWYEREKSVLLVTYQQRRTT